MNEELNLDGTKIALPVHSERLRAFLAGEHIAPITIDMALTQKCQMACKFCLPPDSMILLSNGMQKRMQNIRIGDSVVSVAPDGQPSKSTVIAQWRTGRDPEPTISVRTRDRLLRCTVNHPVLTPQGWKEAGALKIGDQVATVLYSTEPRGAGHMATKDESLVGFSSRSGQKESFECRSAQADLCRSKVSFGSDENEQPDERSKGGGQGTQNPLDSRGKKTSIRSDEAHVEIGKNQLGASGNGQAFWDQPNRSQTANYPGSPRVQIRRGFGLLDSKHVQRIIEESRLHLEERPKQNSSASQRDLLAYAPECKLESRTERLSEDQMAGIRSLDSESSSELALAYRRIQSENLVGWDTVTWIEDSGDSPVYDLECTPHHNFIADGVVVHNCYANLQQYPADAIGWGTWQSFLHDCTTIGHKPGEGVKAISLVSDGESTLSKSYYRFIEYGKGRGIDMASGTNGEALKLEKMDLLAECLTYLRINFNAATPESNARIMGTSEAAFWRVVRNVSAMVATKQRLNANVTIGLQMVLMPEYKEEIVPLAKFGRELGVDYLIIKHCSDDEKGSIGVNYDWYKTEEATALFKEAETYSTPDYKVHVKWSKFATGRDRQYSKCFGTALHLQLSGSGIVAPCGPLFHPQYAEHHIGDLKTARFADIWASQRYRDVIDHLRGAHFDPRKACATLCLQDRTNLALFDLIEHAKALPVATDNAHRNFL